MLLQFECSNHRSIKEQVTFTMLAGTDDTREECLINVDKHRFSRSAVIYGANGSGKSNFIDALDFMRSLVLKSSEHNLDEPVAQYPHKLSQKGTPSEYDIQFMYNKIRYAYGFSVKDGRIHSEYLYYFPKNKQVKVFERTGMKVQPGDKYKGSFDSCKRGILQPNKLLLSVAPNNTDVKEVKEAFRFFKQGMIIFGNVPLFDLPLFDLPFLGWLDISASMLMRNEALKKDFIKLLQQLGTNVKDIKIIQRRGEKSDNVSKGNQGIPKFLDNLFMGPQHEIKMVYDQFEIDLMKEESKGVKRLFQVIAPVLLGLDKGQVLIFDELELSLHERLLVDLVKLFQEHKKERGSQLIFSTHDTNLLDAGLFRRDQVWFTELNQDRATDLYSLVEIKNVRKYENLAKGYVSGKYGAIPMCNEDIVQEMNG